MAKDQSMYITMDDNKPYRSNHFSYASAAASDKHH